MIAEVNFLNKFYEQFITKDYGTLPNTINIISKSILLIGIAIFAIVGILGIFLSIPMFIVFILIEIYMSKKFLGPIGSACSIVFITLLPVISSTCFIKSSALPNLVSIFWELKEKTG